MERKGVPVNEERGASGMKERKKKKNSKTETKKKE